MCTEIGEHVETIENLQAVVEARRKRLTNLVGEDKIAGLEEDVKCEKLIEP